MNKIAIVNTYHGRFRDDIGFWFKSIEFNPTIDFFLFTDLSVPVSLSNLKVIKMSFDELVAITQKNFDFKIVCDRPQKHPDYRPAFGEIFKDYLKNYDFWGHSEQDLFYGDIRAFITDDILDKYDRILGNGHLTLYRNTPEVNSEYKKVKRPYYKVVYSHNRNFFFEEGGGTRPYWINERPSKYFYRPFFDDINIYNDHFMTYHETVDKHIQKHFIYSFEQGKAFRYYEDNGLVKKVETLYVHYQKRNLEVRCEPQNRFMVIPNAIIPFQENVTVDFLRKYAYHRCKYFHSRFYIQWWQRAKVKWVWIKNPIDLENIE